jgi:hypothetical protein
MLGGASRSPGRWDVRHLRFNEGPKMRKRDAHNRMLAAEQGNLWVKVDLHGLHMFLDKKDGYTFTCFLTTKTAAETANAILGRGPGV